MYPDVHVSSIFQGYFSVCDRAEHGLGVTEQETGTMGPGVTEEMAGTSGLRLEAVSSPV